jgi:CDP-6-deoxy-D-xylo-4-hexulose-3-dehydrase
MIKVPIATVSMGSEEISAALDVLNSGHLTMGQEVDSFEREFAKYIGSKHFVMVNSGSSANLLMIETLLRPTNRRPKLVVGDLVLVPAIAWPTTIWPLVQLGLKPIFVDVNEETLAMEPEEIRRLLSNGLEVRAILLIHPLGLALDMEPYAEIARDFDLILLSDVCESLGAKREEKHAGFGSLMRSYSFYFSHHITTMEGGGLATDDDEIYDDLLSMRSHGWSRGRSDAANWKIGLSEPDSRFLFVTTGFNLRPTELQAAIGRVQLRRLDDFVDKRKAMALRIYRAISGTNLQLVSGTTVPDNERTDHSWMLLPIRICSQESVSIRDMIMSFLESNGVATRPVLTGNFLAQPAVRVGFPTWPKPENYKVAEKVTRTMFLVGAHHEFSEDQISHLAETLKAAARLAS